MRETQRLRHRVSELEHSLAAAEETIAELHAFVDRDHHAFVSAPTPAGPEAILPLLPEPLLLLDLEGKPLSSSARWKARFAGREAIPSLGRGTAADLLSTAHTHGQARSRLAQEAEEPPPIVVVSVVRRTDGSPSHLLVRLEPPEPPNGPAVLDPSRLASELLANTSHELRTPLNSILALGRHLVEDATLAQDHREQIQVVVRNGENLMTLVKRMLSLSALQNDEVPIEPTEVTPRKLLENIARAHLARARNKGLGLGIEHSLSAPETLFQDPRHLHEVLDALVSNAIKFTERGRITLRFDASPEAGRALFEVQDTGPGIEPRVIDKIFEPFVRADGSVARQHEGAGLGLSLSRRHASLLGGDLSCVSEPGRGSRFILSIPCHLEIDEVLLPEDSPNRSPAPPANESALEVARDTPERPGASPHGASPGTAHFPGPESPPPLTRDPADRLVPVSIDPPPRRPLSAREELGPAAESPPVQPMLPLDSARPEPAAASASSAAPPSTPVDPSPLPDGPMASSPSLPEFESLKPPPSGAWANPPEDGGLIPSGSPPDRHRSTSDPCGAPARDPAHETGTKADSSVVSDRIDAQAPPLGFALDLEGEAGTTTDLVGKRPTHDPPAPIEEPGERDLFPSKSTEDSSGPSYLGDGNATPPSGAQKHPCGKLEKTGERLPWPMPGSAHAGPTTGVPEAPPAASPTPVELSPAPSISDPAEPLPSPVETSPGSGTAPEPNPAERLESLRSRRATRSSPEDRKAGPPPAPAPDRSKRFGSWLAPFFDRSSPKPKQAPNRTPNRSNDLASLEAAPLPTETEAIESITLDLVSHGVDCDLSPHQELSAPPPVEESKESQNPKEPKEPKEPEREGLDAARRVLVVEDNPDNRYTVRVVLESAGFDVSLAPGGAEGIEAAKQHQPDVILMDMMMPGMDGYEATRQLRKLPAFAHVPIVALTASAMKGDADRCLEAGSSHYLSKPFDPEGLVQLLVRLTSPVQSSP